MEAGTLPGYKKTYLAVFSKEQLQLYNANVKICRMTCMLYFYYIYHNVNLS